PLAPDLALDRLVPGYNGLTDDEDLVPPPADTRLLPAPFGRFENTPSLDHGGSRRSSDPVQEPCGTFLLPRHSDPARRRPSPDHGGLRHREGRFRWPSGKPGWPRQGGPLPCGRRPGLSTRRPGQG